MCMSLMFTNVKYVLVFLTGIHRSFCSGIFMVFCFVFSHSLIWLFKCVNFWVLCIFLIQLSQIVVYKFYETRFFFILLLRCKVNNDCQLDGTRVTWETDLQIHVNCGQRHSKGWGLGLSKRRVWAEHQLLLSLLPDVDPTWAAASSAYRQDFPDAVDCTLKLWDKINLPSLPCFSQVFGHSHKQHLESFSWLTHEGV